MSQHAIDESSLLSARHVRSLLEWVQECTEAPGAVFHLTLPEGEFGELLVHRGGGRKVPVTSKIAAVLRKWIGRSGLKPGDLLFPSECGGPLSASVYWRVWKQARAAVLSPDQVES